MADAGPVPYEEGYFTIPATAGIAPRLIGSRCRACGEHFFPQRLTCAKCLSEDTEQVQLGPRGRLYTHTFLYAPGFGEQASATPGYAVGQIDLREGPRVQSLLIGERGAFRIGMEMELALESVGEDKQGRKILMYRFRPVG